MLRRGLRTSEDVRALSLSSRDGLHLASFARAPSPQSRAVPTSKMAAPEAPPLLLSALPRHWPGGGVRTALIGRERCGGGGGAVAGWSQEWATRREQRPQAPRASRPEKDFAARGRSLVSSAPFKPSPASQPEPLRAGADRCRGSPGTLSRLHRAISRHPRALSRLHFVTAPFSIYLSII